MFDIARARVVFMALALAGAVAACSSPEATRMRAAGPGADTGNRTTRVITHEGSQPYYLTPRLTNVPPPPPEPASQARAVESGRR